MMATIKGRAKIIPPDRDAIFLPFQSKWIKDNSRLKLMEKARQIGISWSTAYGTDERAAAQGARFDEWVSSRDDIQARLFIEDCKLWAGIMNLAAQDLGEVVIDAKDKLTAYVLQFASGRRIHSMSSNPDAQAGKRVPRKHGERDNVSKTGKTGVRGSHARSECGKYWRRPRTSPISRQAGAHDRARTAGQRAGFHRPHSLGQVG